ncbi:MAG: hypothetical protein GX817_04835 [Elusimicrobia bacterium]|nr:hypothetical protein [Elusimicrobiota bacterium]
MEKAYRIENISELKGFQAEDYSRIYYGSEFCQHLLPELSELSQVVDFAKKTKIGLSLLTPYLTNRGIDKVLKLMELLIEEEKELDQTFEIIINDYGLIHALREQKKPLKVVGRLLSWQKRAIRPYLKDENFDPDLSNFNTYSPDYIKLLKSYGINRIEFDNTFWGLPENLKEYGLGVSVYVPYVFIAFTSPRFCLHGNNVWTSDCLAACRGKPPIIMKSPRMPLPLIMKGNAQFYKNENLEKNIENKGVDRIVYENP